MVESDPQLVYNSSRIVNKFLVEWSTVFVGIEGVTGLVNICPTIAQSSFLFVPSLGAYSSGAQPMILPLVLYATAFAQGMIDLPKDTSLSKKLSTPFLFSFIAFISNPSVALFMISERLFQIGSSLALKYRLKENEGLDIEKINQLNETVLKFVQSDPMAIS